jgi:hypothetical protein
LNGCGAANLGRSRLLAGLNLGHFSVGQDGILRPIGNRPVAWEGVPYGPITNRPQIDNLPHTKVQNVQTQAQTEAGLPDPIVAGIAQALDYLAVG